MPLLPALLAGALVLLAPLPGAGLEGAVSHSELEASKNAFSTNIGSRALAMVEPLLEMLASSDSCFPCLVLARASAALSRVAEVAYSLLRVPVGVLLPVLFAMWVAIRSARLFLGWTESAQRQLSPWKEVAEGTGVFLVCAIAAGVTGGADLHKELFAPFYQLLKLSAASGASIMETFVSMGAGAGAQQAKAGSALAWSFVTQYEPELTSQINASGSPTELTEPLTDALEFLLYFAAYVHFISKTGIESAAALWMCVSLDSRPTVGIGLLALGALVFLLFTVFLVSASLRLLDPLVRFFLVLGFSPVLLACASFKATRNLLQTAARALLFCFFFFLVAGVVFSVLYHVLFTESGFLAAADRIAGATSDGAPAGRPRIGCRFVPGSGSQIDFMQVFQLFITVLLAQSLVGQISNLTSQLVDYRLQGGLGEQVGQQAMSIGRSSIMMAGYAAFSSARLFLR